MNYNWPEPYLRRLSNWVWREQEDAIHFGLKLQEETITELLLLRMARECQGTGLHIKMFNRIEEGGSKRTGKPGNGADWEWYVSTPSCNVGFRVQAKVLLSGINFKKKSMSAGRYSGLRPSSTQAQDLIDAAEEGGFNPIYVFYNHPWISNRDLFSTLKSPITCSPGDWGCSVSSAAFVRDFVTSNADNSLSGLIRGMMPWHLFFRMDKGCGPKTALAQLGSGQGFIPDTPRPEWLGMLTEPSADSEASVGVNRYLIDRDLAGVAHFDFSEFSSPEPDSDISYRG